MKHLKYLFGLITMLLTFSTLSHGQNFEISKDSSTLTGDAGSSIKIYNSITNLTQDSIEFRWVRYQSNLPDKWSTSGICDKNSCYTGTDSATFTLAPSETGDLSIEFYPFYFDEENNINPVEGTGTLNVLLYPVDSGRDQGKKAFFKASTNSTSIESHKSSDFKVFPNPVDEHLWVQTSSMGRHDIIIYNTSGTQVLSETFKGERPFQMNLKELKSGTYFLMIQNQNGKPLSKPFIKD